MASIRYYTTAEAAQVLGISEGLARRYCREGRLGQRIGRNFAITAEQLSAFRKLDRRVGHPVVKAAPKRKAKRV